MKPRKHIYKGRERERGRELYRENRDKYIQKARAYRLKQYGTTEAQVAAMLETQAGLCAICTNPMVPGKLTCVDHCHKIGKVRSLLCQNCNAAIGMLREDPFIISSALSYIEAHNG